MLGGSQKYPGNAVQFLNKTLCAYSYRKDSQFLYNLKSFCLKKVFNDIDETRNIKCLCQIRIT